MSVKHPIFMIMDLWPFLLSCDDMQLHVKLLILHSYFPTILIQNTNKQKITCSAPAQSTMEQKA